jgi:NAD(P)-dependent dehydrogenase (short-subunit alcohol dehydrogenase family)
MGYRILLAGAAGAIGSRLVPLLLDAGHAVVGTTRSPAKADMLRASGVEPLVVDVFEAGVLKDAVVSIRPEIVIHQLTDLPPGLDPSGMAQAIAGNARIRDEGTRNLVRAAVAAGSRRLIVKALHGPMPRASCLTGRMLRSTGTPKATARSPSMESSHWNDRYSAPHRSKASSFAMGDCMAPGTGIDSPPASMPLHVDAAAYAALLAVDTRSLGIFNIAEPNDEVATEKATAQLGWNASFRLPFRPIAERRS